MPPEPGQHGLNGLCAGELIDDPAVAQQHGHRYAAHHEAGCQGGVLLGINLDDGRCSGQFFSNGPHRRCE